MDTVLVTGSSSGFGLETSLLLAERGFRVYATVEHEHECPAVLAAASQRGIALRALRLDVTDRASIDAAVAEIAAEAGAIFGLVNNAGLGLRGCFEDLSDEEIRRVFEVNVFGVMAVTQRVLPHMRAARRGRVVTISSIGGMIASFGLAGYCATKFAMEGFGEALSLELAPFGLHSILIEPGIVNTPHWTVNRGTAAAALDPRSPYYRMFQRHEAIADRRTATARTRPLDVARAVHEALTARRPRLRYVVGRPAGLALALRRYLPDELFERLYFGFLLRQITRDGMPRPPARTETRRS
jgi:NAD(P)-dependent dehydrogenase (short-subunit alcohol dehydrogenase family)